MIMFLIRASFSAALLLSLTLTAFASVWACNATMLAFFALARNFRILWINYGMK